MELYVQHSQPHKYHGPLWMILASLLFASMGATVKFATVNLPSTQVVFFRFLISLLIYVPWMLRRRESFTGNNRRLLYTRSLFGFAAGVLAFYTTAQIPLADAYILTHSSPIWVALLSAILLREHVTPRLLFFIGLATVACILILKPGLAVSHPATILGVVSAWCSACAYISIKQLHKTDSALTTVFHYSAVSTLGALLLFGHQFIMPTFLDWVYLILCGLFGTFGQLALTYAYKHSPASYVSPFAYSVIGFTMIMGIVFWNDTPDASTMLGGLLMAGAGIGIAKGGKAQATQNRSTQPA